MYHSPTSAFELIQLNSILLQIYYNICKKQTDSFFFFKKRICSKSAWPGLHLLSNGVLQTFSEATDHQPAQSRQHFLSGPNPTPARGQNASQDVIGTTREAEPSELEIRIGKPTRNVLFFLKFLVSQYFTPAFKPLPTK